MNFQGYIDDFNSGEDDSLVEKYFTEDFVYEGGARRLEGREAWRRFLHHVHDGLREIFRPITSLEGPDCHFCEIDMDFHAIKPHPNFPFGPLAPGDMYTVKFFVVYEQEGDKFKRLKAATWPADLGVSKLPRLGGHITQRAAFQSLQGALAYEDGTNAAQYLCDRVALDNGEGSRADGIAALRTAGVATARLVNADDAMLELALPAGTMQLGLVDGMIASIRQG